MSLVRNLISSEGGRRFLLNLYDGAVAEGHLPRLVARRFLRQINGTGIGTTGPAWHPYADALAHAVFALPGTYQYRGPAPAANEGEWMTVKSAADIGELILASPWLDTRHMRRRFSPFDLSAVDPGLGDADYQTFADLVNDPSPPLRFRLSRAFPPARRGSRSLRPAPVWLSRWCEFTAAHRGLSIPSVGGAGRVRDWLGLPYEGQPLFVIRVRQPLPGDRFLARRPTVLDGISNVLFKHRVQRTAASGCGTTADIERLRRPSGVGQPIDGGPEVVGRRVWFHPARFECIYVGRAPGLGYDLYGGFHARLLGSRDLDELVREVEDALL